MSSARRGSATFPEAARVELRNEQLRRNLGRATRTIRDRRLAVVGEVEDWQALREAGRAIKDATLGRLDEHLLAFERAFTEAGGTVHWAADAAEANAIVVGIVRGHGATEVVKVKSLTTDEIGLNDALAGEGIEAVETDFAELILQLDGDWSSHILVPAIHRNRTEIRDLFRRTIGDEGLSDDPAELAETARLHLRRRFLAARVGVSGANFAVAETGSLVVLESEGNGRMCTTLPEVLISVVGIEKLLPRWDDLEVFLQLLPRSSTGERMNPYTSIWTGATAGDGPREMHVVLLDNGRTDVLRDAAGAPGAALHPLLGVPQRLPRLRAHRRACLRLDLSGPDRRHPHAAAGGRRARGLAALRLQPVRRVRGGVPGDDRDPADPRPPARPRAQAPGRALGDARAGLDVREPQALRAGAAAGPRRRRTAGRVRPAARLDGQP